jgi:hypothetical protein
MKFKNYLHESSLSRLRQHMLEHDTGTITAFRDAEDCGNGPNITKKQNKARNKILLANLRKEGYSVTKVKGSYIENYGTNDAKEVGEEVFFVVDIKDKGNLKNKLMKLGEEFEQDSIMFISKGADMGMLIGTNHCPNGYPGYHKVEKLKNPIFGQSGEFMTRVNGRPFVLKNISEEVEPLSSNMGRWGNSILANKDWKLLSEEME